MKLTSELKGEDITKDKKKTKFTESDDMSLLIQKKNNNKAKNNNSCFRNNYKKFQYDYEEDFYEPRY